MAQEKRTVERQRAAPQTVKETAPNSAKKFAIIIASIVLVAGGFGAAYYLYLKSPLAPTPSAAPTPVAAPEIIPVDAQGTIDVSGLDVKDMDAAVASALAKSTGNPGSVNQIIPISRSAQGTATLSGFYFLVDAGISAPGTLSRSLNPEWMLGTYIDQNGTPEPFMIFSENFFQNAYSGMISWERSMPDDLAAVFPSIGQSVQTASTSALTSYFSIPGNWSDGVIDNKDVRLFSSPGGTILLLYSFVNNGTIVITTSENALAEIISRLENQTSAR